MPEVTEAPVEEQPENVQNENANEPTKQVKAEKPKKGEKSAQMGNLQNEELDWIWIGDAEDARDATRLRQNGVRYVLNCTMPRQQGGVMNYHEKDPKFEYCRVAMADNATEPLIGRIEKAWDFFEKVRIREDGGILVHCQQGVSRSVSMVIAYLIKYYRFTFDDAKLLCQGCRKQANPNEGFEKQLRDMEEHLKKTNGFEKVPPPRKRQASAPPMGSAAKVARGPAGPARGPAGPPRGPVGPSVGPAVGPSVGPSVGPAVGPSVGPAVGPQVGPAVGPSVGPSVGPAVGPSVGPAPPEKVKKDKKEKKEKKEKREMVGPAVGPAPPP